jgi:hypothetical protein
MCRKMTAGFSPCGLFSGRLARKRAYFRSPFSRGGKAFLAQPQFDQAI